MNDKLYLDLCVSVCSLMTECVVASGFTVTSQFIKVSRAVIIYDYKVMSCGLGA